MKKIKTKSTQALFLRFAGLSLLLCLLYLCLVTVQEAKKVQDQWEFIIGDFIYEEFEYAYLENYDLAGVDQNRIDLMYQFDSWTQEYGAENAVIFLENDKPVMESTSFGYIHAWSSADWYSGQSEEALNNLNGGFVRDYWSQQPMVRMDLDSFFGEEHPVLEQLQQDGYYWENWDYFRFSGYFRHDNTFVPVSLSAFKDELPYSDRYKGKALGQWDAEGALEWTVIHENREIDEDAQIVELFCDEIRYYSRGNLSSPFVSSDETLLSMLHDYSSWGWDQNSSLANTVILGKASLIDEHGIEQEVRAAIGGSPLKVAMKQLIPAYILSFAGIIGVIIWFGLLMERWLEKPLKQIIESSENNIAPIHSPHWGKWEDVIQAQRGYMAAQQEVQSLRQENRQLKTALDYAENAEINRRQMVSNITHELKTPLAVIHSYCEGLQAGIAPRKQQKYLSVIAEEADRMDAMVLEMLDLSRLEAGKVKLAQDQVELLELTRSIVDKLQPLLEVKGLEVTFSLAQPSPLTADEGRLAQVITNLTSNAIKYSPEKGKIVISVFQRNGFTHFSIENESAPLSEDALEKVWESFYRTEQSRTSKGTGLGLSICKAIIELHRGSCHVQNTSTGVEFSFFLPA